MATGKTKIVREIHLFRKGGKSPVDGSELSDRTEIKREWDDELTKVRNANYKTGVCCVEFEVNEYGDKKTVHNIPIAIAEADGWFELGIKMPSMRSEGVLQQIELETSQKVLKVSDPAVNELLKQQSEVIKQQSEALEMLKAKIEEMTETTSLKKGGKQ
jgi:hypothetical protein